MPVYKLLHSFEFLRFSFPDTRTERQYTSVLLDVYLFYFLKETKERILFSLIIHVTSTQIYILERLKFFIVLSKSDDLADRLRGIIIDIVVWKRKKKKRTIIFCTLWIVISRINVHGTWRVIALIILHLISFIFDSM